MKDLEMGREYSNGGEMRNEYKFVIGDLKGEGDTIWDV